MSDSDADDIITSFTDPSLDGPEDDMTKQAREDLKLLSAAIDGAYCWADEQDGPGTARRERIEAKAALARIRKLIEP